MFLFLLLKKKHFKQEDVGTTETDLLEPLEPHHFPRSQPLWGQS